MKKRTAVFFIFTMILALSGCGNPSDTNVHRQTEESAVEGTDKVLSEENNSSEVSMEVQDTSVEHTEDRTEEHIVDNGNDANVLVVYFSRTGEQYTVGVIDKGNTAIVAEMIAEKAGADLFEVLPIDDHYPTTYAELTDVAKQEQNNHARPEYSGEFPDLSQYETVFIGAPVWWGDWPMIMYTVFENNDFSGKKLAPFSTHEGSGLSGFDRKLSSACPDSEVSDGLAIRGNDCQNNQDSVRGKVNDWMAGLGY